jgi:ribosomal protein S18 acetylase RimI-like enzyme
MQIRQARPADEAALRQIDAVTWTADTSPAPPRAPDRPFFSAQTRPEDVLVAEADGQAIGYIHLEQASAIRSHQHVLDVSGLAVGPARQGQGAGRRLLEAGVEQARLRGARKLALRVLGPNDRARRLYESCGFRVEGVLRGEFHLGGRYVDDVLMARDLTAR